MVGFENGTRFRWWQWPTVLSLDAPIVVVAWQFLLASVAGVRLGWPHGFVLAASVWLSYWLIGPPVLAYLLSHQLVHRNHPLRVPKEICVALLLGCGAAVFPIAGAGMYQRTLWLALALFVALAFANCALISVWEAEVDRSHGQTSLALQFGGHGWIHGVPWLVAGLSALLVLSGGNLRIAAICSVASAILLGIVDVLHVRLGWRVSRVLADVALLTPLVAMAFGLVP